MLGDPSVPARMLLSAVADRFALDDVDPSEALPAYPPGHAQQGIVRAWVGHGPSTGVAADEEDPENPVGSLVVSQQRITVATSMPGAQAANLGVSTTHAVGWHVRLLRPHPWIGPQRLQLPSPDDITAASLILERDSVRLVDALHAWAAALPNRFTVDLREGVEAIPASGGLAGNRAVASLYPL